MKKKTGFPTLKEISERTDFTVNTVSLALRDSPRVADSTKMKIKLAAKELGYVYNAVAGSLRSGSSKTIAIILGDISNPHFAIKVRELEICFRRQNYQVMILNTDESPELELAAAKTAISHQADGVVICPCQKSDEALKFLDKYSVPYVLTGRHYGSKMDAVIWDDVNGSYIAASHLIEQGCQKILFLNAPDVISSSKERAQGYLQAMNEAGLAPLVRCTPPIAGGVYAELEQLRLENEKIDGIFAFSDLLAWEAAYWLDEHGYSIPDDVKIVGFDNILSHLHMPFALSSISADRKAETQLVANLLLKKIADKNSKENHVLHKVEVCLVARRSSVSEL